MTNRTLTERLKDARGEFTETAAGYLGAWTQKDVMPLVRETAELVPYVAAMGLAAYTGAEYLSSMTSPFASPVDLLGFTTVTAKQFMGFTGAVLGYSMAMFPAIAIYESTHKRPQNVPAND